MLTTYTSIVWFCVEASYSFELISGSAGTSISAIVVKIVGDYAAVVGNESECAIVVFVVRAGQQLNDSLAL